MNSSYEILDILLQYIQKNGTTEKQCLIDCNINTSFLTDWKNGRLKNPSYDKIVKLAKYLNIDLNLLFLGKEKLDIPNITHSNVGAIGNNLSGTVTINNNSVPTNKEINEVKPIVSENAEELLKVFESLPKREQVRLLGIVYDFEEQYHKTNT